VAGSYVNSETWNRAPPGPSAGKFRRRAHHSVKAFWCWLGRQTPPDSCCRLMPWTDLVGIARHAEEMPGAAVGAGHPRWLTVAGDRADRSRLAIVERRPGTKIARMERRDGTREFRRLALEELKIATQLTAIWARRCRRRWCRVGVLLDLAQSRRSAWAGYANIATDVSRRGRKNTVLIGVCGGRRDDRTRDGRRGEQPDFREFQGLPIARIEVIGLRLSNVRGPGRVTACGVALAGAVAGFTECVAGTVVDS
jgi:hypothetical protein